MTIENISIELIEQMDADQMRSTLKSIRTDYDIKVAEDAENQRKEEERIARQKAVVDNFFQMKKRKKHG